MSGLEDDLGVGQLQRQIDVFGRDRMAALTGHEATQESTEALLHTVGAIAVETGSTNHHGEISRSLQRANGRQLVAQVNPHDARGFGSNNVDRPLATVYALKSRDLRVFVPRRRLGIGVYEVDETIYIGRDGLARIFGSFSPIYGSRFREWSAKRNKAIAAHKLASEEEVQEALEIITVAVRYDDKVSAKASEK